MRWYVVLLATMVAGCLPAELVTPGEPTQSGKANPMLARGADSFAQRQRDCWDMPSAQACYEVGLNHELGLTGQPDRNTARDYYDKACAISSDREHCNAAKRMREP